MRYHVGDFFRPHEAPQWLTLLESVTFGLRICGSGEETTDPRCVRGPGDDGVDSNFEDSSPLGAVVVLDGPLCADPCVGDHDIQLPCGGDNDIDGLSTD
ncbi:hypothetical protein GCM10007382_11490 [Salinibacterium xinjiangense]|nr:hypothetical protein GCM10007382_11490 [Salinibacterium xinjiangense]